MTSADANLLRKGAEGYTLLELLVVLGILAFILGAAIPAIRNPRQGLGLKATALELTSQMKGLRTAAISGNSQHILFIDLKRNSYWTNTSQGFRVISPRISLAAQARPEGNAGSSTVQFSFHSDGTASGGVILLREAGRAARIAVDWRSGAPRVEWSQ